MSAARRCYDIPALLRKGEVDMGRIKGDQRGSLVRIGRKYYGRYSKWVVSGTAAEWKAVKEVLCATSEGKARALALLNERVAEANGPAAVLLGNATVQQFVETKFKPEHIDRKKASGRDHYEWALGHILPALGDFRLAQVSQGILQGFIDAKVEAGLAPQVSGAAFFGLNNPCALAMLILASF